MPELNPDHLPADDAPTWEEASRCPRCGQPGEDTKQQVVRNVRMPRGGQRPTMHQLTCRNELCLWYNTHWMVQVNADGSIPKENYNRLQDPIYPRVKRDQRRKEQVLDNIRRQIHIETDGKM